jgi:hypothetical protein
MIVHPSDGSGSGIPFGFGLPLVHVSSYSDAPHNEVHVSVPFATPPSGRTVAPLLTWQVWPALSGEHPTPVAAFNVSALAG